MKRKVSILAGAAALVLANVAVAEEAQVATAAQPILLTDAQMDGVTAGFAFGGGSFFAECVGPCDAFGFGSGFVSVFDNGFNASASADSSLEVTLFNGTVFVFTSAFAGAGN